MNTACTGLFGTMPIDIANPTTAMFDIRDIARSNSKRCRFSGLLPIDGIYSVAQHSVYAAWIVRHLGATPAQVMTALMHDGSEYIMQDIPTPAKRALPDYQRIEADVQAKIYEAYLCDTSERGLSLMHEADSALVLWEANQFGRTWPGKSTTDMRKIFDDIYPGHEPMAPKDAEIFFLDEYRKVVDQMRWGPGGIESFQANKLLKGLAA